MTSSIDRRAPFDRDLLATAALTLYSLAVAFGFARVFSGRDFMVDLGLLVVVGHGVSFLLRRARVSGWLAVPFVFVLLLWMLLALRYGDTLSWLLPTDTTWHELDLETGLVREKFQTAIAPVIYGTGWAALAGFAVAVTVVMADAFAFRAEARGEALVPGGVLFVFIAALGSDRLRIVSTVLLIGTGVVAVVALRALHDRSRRVELTSRRTPSMAVPTAIASAAAIALIAGVIGPRIPGAQAEAVYDTRGRGGDTTVISPLVDIRTRLTNRGNVELFRVNADAAAYWRVTTLPEFDGRRFRLPRRDLERVEGSFGTGEGAQIRQQIQVLSLGGRLVPAAPDPFRASGYSGGTELGLRLNSDTSTLLAPEEIQAGDLFTVVSATPTLDPDVLRGVSVSSPPDPIFTELPDDLPSVVGELARSVTTDAQSPYDQAIALQQWFREQFDYSLEVQAGHGSNDIESFLQQRVGYCEQFSATFAAMARTLGIPSRVAVGFTPGVLNDEGWYSVLGKNAHAWPELWFDEVGWVLFEPTPGRGAPGAEAYTGVAAAQDTTGQLGTGGGGTDAAGDPLPTTPSTVVAPPTTVGDATPASTVAPIDGETPQSPAGGGTFGGELASGDETAATDSNGVPWRALLAVAVLFGLLSIPAVGRWWKRREARSLGPDARVHAAWGRARHAAELAGVGGTPAMTPREWAAATATQLPVAARPMASLAAVVDQVAFSQPGSIDLERAGAYGSTLRHDCELWSNQVDRIATDTLTTRQRIAQYFVGWR